MTDPALTIKKARTRSPSYPSFDLPTAIEKIRLAYDANDRHPVHPDSLATNLKYTATSSSFMQAISTLKQFGLLSDTGWGDKRRVAVSDVALDILLAEEDSEKHDAAIKKAALSPQIHSELWGKYGGKLPPKDEAIRFYLLKEREGAVYNKGQVDGIIAEFRSTIAFAKLAEGDIIERNGGQAKSNAIPKVGDYVQWSPGGVDQFPQPRQLSGISDDQVWAFVVGSQTGVPMSELAAVDQPAITMQSAPPANPFFKADEALLTPGLAKMQTVLDEGPVALTWPDNLTEESVVELEYWLKGVMRRARRRAGMPEEGEKEKGDTKKK